MKEIFNVIPEIEELINFAKFKQDVDVPLEEGMINVRFAVLWEGEDYKIMKRSGELINPLDGMTRGKYLMVETLVWAIESIGQRSYIDDDKDKNELLKNELRIVLQSMNQFIVKHLYWLYEQIVKYQEVYVNEKFEPLKKKFQENLKNLRPLSKPTSE